jgi:serine protease AprX
LSTVIPKTGWYSEVVTQTKSFFAGRNPPRHGNQAVDIFIFFLRGPFMRIPQEPVCWLRAVFALFLGMASGVLPLIGQENKLAPDLAFVAPDQEIEVIIQLEDLPEERGAGRPPAPLRLPAALSARGPLRELSSIRGLVTRITGSALSALTRDPQVKYISPNRKVSAASNWGPASVGAIGLQTRGYTGAGVGVAVIDSGVSPHLDFLTPNCEATSRIEYFEDFVETKNQQSRDPYGHGTAVAGLVAGNGLCKVVSMGLNRRSIENASGKRLAGVAPQAKIVSLRVLDDEGVGTDANVIKAIDRAIQLKTRYNIRVMNLSLGRTIWESFSKDPLCQAVERAWKAGIVVVVAAGNRGRTESLKDKNGKVYKIGGYGTIGSPGNDPYVITVGAMNDKGNASVTDDTITSYSSKGPTAIDNFVKPDLVAPGNWVHSTRGAGNDGLFGKLSRDTSNTTTEEKAYCKSTDYQYNICLLYTSPSPRDV